jgi:HSP20 family molecular chaperone IbpA
MRSLDRFFDAALQAPVIQTNSCRIEQDDKAYTLSFDVPGVTRDQLSIGIEGNVVRLETLPEAAASTRRRTNCRKTLCAPRCQAEKCADLAGQGARAKSPS